MSVVLTKQQWMYSVDRFLNRDIQKKFVEYVMPRQSGVTTYLVGSALKLAAQGNRVILITERYDAAKQISRKMTNDVVTDVVIVGISNVDFRGLSIDAYDYILIDGVRRRLFSNKREEDSAMEYFFYTEANVLLLGTDE
jgi:hypothetical protein